MERCERIPLKPGLSSFSDLEEAERAPSWAAGVARDGKGEGNGSSGGGRRYNHEWPGNQNGNPGRQDLIANFRETCR